MGAKSAVPLLEDMISHCRAVMSYASGMDKTAFLADSRTIDAICMNIAVIGECAGSILRSFPDAASAAHDIPMDKIYSMRNIIVHHYGSVSPEIVWNICSERVPALLGSLEKLLEAVKRH